MVVECTQEIDVTRIGIDRYSLKTGLKFKTVMDLSTRVLKEPRGFMRVIQCLMAILAFATTASFSTDSEFLITCPGEDLKKHQVTYDFGYPFQLSDNFIDIPKDCSTLDDNSLRLTLPFDFSNAAEFFVATGVITFLYTIMALVVYIFFHQTYANNSKVPVIDLSITAILSVFWLAGSSAWAQGVSDLKYYLHPETLFKLLCICQDKSQSDKPHCQTVEDGTYGTLNASLILGFANFILWAASLWFIYKETIFHTPAAEVQPTQNQAAKEVGRV